MLLLDPGSSGGAAVAAFNMTSTLTVSSTQQSLPTLMRSALPILPRSVPFLLAATATTTALTQNTKLTKALADVVQPETPSQHKQQSTILPWNPRVQSCICMTLAMAFHYGGYEFARSGALALFTSSETGFSAPSAYPFALGLVTPVSLALLYAYGVILQALGPRYALWTTKLVSIFVLTACTIMLKVWSSTTNGRGSSLVTKSIVAILFIFQNSYLHLLRSQQWSFLGSIMTPTEGAKWFSAIAGISSVVCTVAATLVHNMASVVGLHGLILGTAATLVVSLLFADRAYQLGEEVGYKPDTVCRFLDHHSRIAQPQHGFDPSKTMQAEKLNKMQRSRQVGRSSLFAETQLLFQRVPTLAMLFWEVISFQCLSTVLNVCFVRQLKESMPSDTDRAAFSGQFYAYTNGSAAIMQFFVLPLARKYMEPKWVFRLMPLLLSPFLVYAAFQASTLWLASGAFFLLKTLDYSLRNVVSEMVYQPLDFQSRYLGKEVIGVFANRFGKSAMSMILSLVTPFGIVVSQLSQLAVALAGSWALASFWLSGHVLSNQEAERLVQQRHKKTN